MTAETLPRCKCHPTQIISGVERHESEALRLEAELNSEAASQQQEIADITAAYKRSEAIIIKHLQCFQRSLGHSCEEDQCQANSKCAASVESGFDRPHPIDENGHTQRGNAQPISAHSHSFTNIQTI